MADTVSICNQALSAMGTQSTIASIDENSREAKECKKLFTTIRDELLAKSLWNFARRVVTLAQLKARSTALYWSSAEPPSPWDYSYAYPSDCLRVRYVWPAGLTGAPPINPGYWPVSGGYYSGQWASPYAPSWALEGVYCNNPPYGFAVLSDQDSDGNDIRVIATNLGQPLLVYTRRVESVNLWSPLFVRAMVAELAYRLSTPLSGDKDLRKDNYQLAQAAMAEADQADGNEGITIVPSADPDWICARG